MSQYLKDVFDIISVDIKECELLILCNKMYHHLEELNNSLKPHFLNAQYTMLQNQA